MSDIDVTKYLNTGKTGKILYCVTWEKWDTETGAVVPMIDYTHANDRGDAWMQFYGSLSAQHCRKIVGIAPVIGYHVNDEHGEDISV